MGGIKNKSTLFNSKNSKTNSKINFFYFIKTQNSTLVLKILIFDLPAMTYIQKCNAIANLMHYF